MHKFAISGSHGTGKTTLIAALRADQRDMPILPEVARAVCAESGDPAFFRRGNNDFTRQLLLVSRQIADEASPARDDVPWLVTDRSVADHWAYTEALFPAEAESGVGVQFRSLVYKWMCTYCRVFLLRPEFKVSGDGVREDDQAFQASIDSVIRSHLVASGVPLTEVSGSVEDRVRKVLEHMKSDLMEGHDGAQ